jgi:molecular chaperone GrpE
MERRREQGDPVEAEGPGGAGEAEGVPTEGVPAEAAVPETPAEDPIARLEAEVANLKDQLLRALAETENSRRRSQRERDEAVRYAASGFARDMLPVADNLRRALDAVPEEAMAADESLKTLADGVGLTERQLIAAFERHGIRRVAPEPGERFDPHLHQAMFEVPNTGQPAGSIVQVMQPGYLLHDRLLRPAMVGVAKGSAGEGNGAAPSGNGTDN